MHKKGGVNVTSGITAGVVWFIAIILFLIIEGLTYQIVSIYLAIGAVGALITYLLGFGYMAQVMVFLILSLVLLCLLRPISMKYIRKTKTNADSIIGKRVYITKEVNNIADTGEGKVGGMYWSVRSADNTIIPENSVAIVEKIEGVKLIVKGE